jgi:transporter family protein
MNWLIFSVLAGFFFAASRVFARLLLQKQGDALAFTAINDFVSGLVLVPLIFAQTHFPQHPITWLYFLGIVIFAFISDWLSFVALKIIDVSLYQIVNQVRLVFILFGGFLLFNEAISSAKIAAIILIVVGVIIALYEKSKIYFNKGVVITIFSTLFAVIAFLFSKATVADFSEAAAASLELMLIGILGFGFLKFNPVRLGREFKLQKWGIVVAGLCFGLFEMFLFFALHTGEVSKVIPVTQVSLIFAVLAGIIFLRERSCLWQKIIGTVFIVIGIIFIYLF